MKPAWVAIAVAFVLGSCAQQDWIDRTLVTVDVTGVWEAASKVRVMPPVADVSRSFFQRGPKVTGEIKWPASPSTPGVSIGGVQPIEGTVSGDTFTFYGTTGPKTDGEVQVNGDEMIGSLARYGTWSSPFVGDSSWDEDPNLHPPEVVAPARNAQWWKTPLPVSICGRTDARGD